MLDLKWVLIFLMKNSALYHGHIEIPNFFALPTFYSIKKSSTKTQHFVKARCSKKLWYKCTAIAAQICAKRTFKTCAKVILPHLRRALSVSWFQLVPTFRTKRSSCVHISNQNFQTFELQNWEKFNFRTFIKKTRTFKTNFFIWI